MSNLSSFVIKKAKKEPIKESSSPKGVEIERVKYLKYY
jgi:hypothetical protein